MNCFDGARNAGEKEGMFDGATVYICAAFEMAPPDGISLLYGPSRSVSTADSQTKTVLGGLGDVIDLIKI